MEDISDREILERELHEAVASDGLKEPNQACDAAVKLTNALPRSAGGRSKDGDFFQTKELLSYLSKERSVSRKAAKWNIPNGVRRKDAERDDAEVERLVSSILAERNVELTATSSEECCADLVGELAGDLLFEAKPWVGSSSDRTTHMDKVQQTLLNSVLERLPRLIAEKVRSKASKDVTVVCQSPAVPSLREEYDQLARSLEKRVATTMCLDVEGARCLTDIAKLEAKFEAYAGIAGQLLAQNARLRRVAVADKVHASHLENVASGLSVVHDSLASRLKQCSSLVAATTSTAVDSKIPQGTAAHSADLTTTDHEGALDELCTESLRTATARTEAVDKLVEEQEEIHELADALSAELSEACQGSVKTWCMNQASVVKPDRMRAVIRELFREFHEDPERFLRRVHSVQKGACRDT